MNGSGRKVSKVDSKRLREKQRSTTLGMFVAYSNSGSTIEYLIWLTLRRMQ